MLDFLKTAKEVKENYWALLIEPEWISSAVWQITDSKVEIVCTSPATRWESDLTESIDASLSSCTQKLSQDVPDPSKTVFGIPNAWIEGGNIKDEYLEKLKKVCQDLSLVPSGFVVLSEAISHFIKQEEESSFSGIVVGISNNVLDISIFNLGKLIGTTSVFRSISVEEDIIEGICRLASELENLPPRIILFNQKEQELEEIKNSLNGANWNKIGNSKFIHTPKIEILDPSRKILAVALAGGSELGGVNGMIDNAVITDSGDIVEEKINEETNKSVSYEVNNVEEPDNVTAEDLGFTVGSHVTTAKDMYEQQTVKLPAIPKFSFKKPQFKFTGFNFVFDSRLLIMIGSLMLTIFVVCFVLWWFLPKASVTVYVSPKKLEESINLSVGTDIKGQEIDITVSGEKTKSTTGTKTVGEKAKGSVKIQNGTGESVNLKTGTILTSSSDLKFVTTKSASISAALSTTEPGFTNVDIEAYNIGSEYNLLKDERFKVSNYPRVDVEAISIDNFTGGSSRQISSVAEDDRKKILKELRDELIEEAKLKLKEKITSEKILVEASFKIETKEENFSNKIGDEATNLKLNLVLMISSTVVSKQDLLDIVRKNLEGKIPTGFVLRNDQINYDFGSSSKDGIFEVKIIAKLLPDIDAKEIAKRIMGRYPNIAESYLRSVPGFLNAEIRIRPTLIGKFGTLPHVSKNINVIITSE